jgi:transposase
MAATLVKLRKPTAEEREELERLARSRTAEARLVVRAKIVLGLAAGERPYQVADRVGVGRMAVYIWLHRFNAEGLTGLTDHPRPGRPPTYTAAQRAEVIAAALTKPEDLGLPFASWTLDRLRAYLSEHKGIGIKRTRIDEVLIAEGLRWRKQETGFGQKVDPEFAAKRGRSRNSTPARPKGRPSSASTRWGRNRPRASRAKR